MFGKNEILTRIDSLDQRLLRIEATLQEIQKSQSTAPKATEGGDGNRRQVNALSQQGLHLVQLLDEARTEIEQLKRGQSS